MEKNIEKEQILLGSLSVKKNHGKKTKTEETLTPTSTKSLLKLIDSNPGIKRQPFCFNRLLLLRLENINDPKTETNYSNLEEAWKAYNKSQGRVNNGLINRRNAEWNIYSKGIYEKW